jgi:hypothetical protein
MHPVSSLDLAIGFATQFIIFYFILTRLNAALGFGRLEGALLLATIFTTVHAIISARTGRRMFY